MKTPASRGAALWWSLVLVAGGGSLSTLSLAAAPRAYAQELEFPETGTAAERVRKLWSSSRTRILDDAKAALTDAEYQKRRVPIWGAWTRMQMVTAGDDDVVGQLIPDILSLLNSTYGWTAFPPAKRQEIRDRARPFTPKHVAEMDERVAALK
jgi:hypothetical protein